MRNPPRPVRAAQAHEGQQVGVQPQQMSYMNNNTLLIIDELSVAKAMQQTLTDSSTLTLHDEGCDGGSLLR